MNHQHGATRRRTSARRAVLFRLLAVGLSLSPLVLFEAAFTALDWGRATEIDDPYIGFSEVHPLFVPDATGENYEIPVSRQQLFRPQSFPAVKAPGAYRIFCLGGSTVQGRPYAVETSFTTWLRLSLEAADPSRRWEVINCGGVSYASYRLAPIMRQLIDHQADLFIIYTGHNEFLEDRTYQQVKQTPALVARGHRLMSQFRTYCALRSGWTRLRAANPSSPRPVLGGEVEAMLDFRGGLEDYHRDDDWRRATIDHFDFNLRRMIAMAGEAGIPVILANPVSNLKDSPPFKVEHSSGLTKDQLARFESLWGQVQAVEPGDWRQQCRLLREAIAIDDRHAGAHFYLGKCYQAMNRHEEAKLAFLRAKDEDVCPLRILEPMHDVVLRVARETDTPLVDVRRHFESKSTRGIPGEELLIDHVHPSVRGHQMIAELFLERLADERIVLPADDWRQRRTVLYREHWKTLDIVYFERGKQRLEGLKRWTQGRALKLRGDDRRPGS